MNKSACQYSHSAISSSLAHVLGESADHRGNGSGCCRCRSAKQGISTAGSSNLRLPATSPRYRIDTSTPKAIADSRQDACTYHATLEIRPTLMSRVAVPQVVPYEAEARQSAEAESPYPAVDQTEDEQHHQVRRRRRKLRRKSLDDGD